MKNRLLTAVLLIGLIIPAFIGAAELMNITTEGVDGNWVIYDKSKNEIVTFDAANRAMSIPSGSYITGLATKETTHVFTTLADWTLSATEMICNLLITSSGSGGANIIAPAAPGREYVVRNAGDGTVTIKKSAGTGVSIASGKTATVRYSATAADYIRITADATH